MTVADVFEGVGDDEPVRGLRLLVAVEPVQRFRRGRLHYHRSHVDWHLVWWACALAGWALSTVLSLRRVKINGRILAGLLVLGSTLSSSAASWSSTLQAPGKLHRPVPEVAHPSGGGGDPRRRLCQLRGRRVLRRSQRPTQDGRVGPRRDEG